MIVIRHSNWGAMRAACDHYKGDSIGEIVELIDPAEDLEKQLRSTAIRRMIYLLGKYAFIMLRFKWSVS